MADDVDTTMTRDERASLDSRSRVIGPSQQAIASADYSRLIVVGDVGLRSPVTPRRGVRRIRADPVGSGRSLPSIRRSFSATTGRSNRRPNWLTAPALFLAHFRLHYLERPPARAPARAPARPPARLLLCVVRE